MYENIRPNMEILKHMKQMKQKRGKYIYKKMKTCFDPIHVDDLFIDFLIAI